LSPACREGGDVSEFFERLGREAAQGRPEAPTPQPIGGYDEPGARPNFAAGFKRWGAIDGTAFYGVAETHDTLPAGFYRCNVAQQGAVLLKQRVDTDRLLELPDDAGARILEEFATFWEIGDKFEDRGFLQKRGYLLWGPPGSGKTSTLQLMVKRLIEHHQGVVLLIDHPHPAAACLQLTRGIEADRPLIGILEDIDALVMRYGEHEFLALLDGEAQVNRIAFIATTNYPERLDRRFVDRPSRFDTIRYIGMPSAAARRLYLGTKEPSLKGDDLDIWVAKSDGFSIAHLKEMIIAVRCFGQPLQEVVERLEEMQERQPASDKAPDRMPFGFGRQIGGVQRLGNGAGHR
jgi:hypothetical protein